MVSWSGAWQCPERVDVRSLVQVKGHTAQVVEGDFNHIAFRHVFFVRHSHDGIKPNDERDCILTTKGLVSQTLVNGLDPHMALGIFEGGRARRFV